MDNLYLRAESLVIFWLNTIGIYNNSFYSVASWKLKVVIFLELVLPQLFLVSIYPENRI